VYRAYNISAVALIVWLEVADKWREEDLAICKGKEASDKKYGEMAGRRLGDHGEKGGKKRFGYSRRQRDSSATAARQLWDFVRE